jgi:hypothetical protein
MEEIQFAVAEPKAMFLSKTENGKSVRRGQFVWITIGQTLGPGIQKESLLLRADRNVFFKKGKNPFKSD